MTDRERKPDLETVRERRSDAKVDREIVAAPTKALIASGDAPEPARDGDGHSRLHSRERGALLGRYVVLSLLGAGGMGEVYTAYDPALDRRIALKVLRPQFDKGSMSTARGLLLAEAQSLAKLSHPNIVAVYDVGTFDDDVYLAMEYVEGTTLTERLRESYTLVEIVDTFVAAGRGLEAAHAAGIVHRDFKPDNVILGKDGRPRVIDFGIAQQATAHDADTISGTPAFMAPEQFRRGKVGPAADQFSFAVALYIAVFKQYPFAGDDEDTVTLNIVEGKVRPPPANSGVPTGVRDAILRALSRKPEARHASLGDLLVAIKPPPRRRRRVYALAAGVPLAAAATIAVVMLRGSDAAEPCRGFEGELTGIWDPARKLALQAKVEADAWPTIEKLFDTYAKDWTHNKQSACRATAVTREQTPLVLERRMACLDTRLRELDATVAIAAAGIASRRVIDIGSNLRSPGSCANLAALAPVPATAPPSAIATVEAGIAAIRAKRLAGEFRGARNGAEGVISNARALGWIAGIARALVERGLSEAADGDPKAARETLFEAVRSGEVGRDPASEAAAWIGLVSVEAGGLRQPSEALRWAKHAENALANAGNDQEQQGELLHSIAGALRVLDRDVEALDHERRALALLEHAFGPRHARVANQRAAVATALRHVGNLDEAIREAESALQMLEELAGFVHPYVASLLNGLALTYDEAGRIEDARRALERAITISELELGDTHLRLANPLMNLVALERRAGHVEAAENLWERAYAIRVANLGNNHPDVARALHGKMLDRINRGLDDEARALVNEVVTRQRARTDAIELSSALALRCELERRANNLDEARATCAEAIVALSTPIDSGRALFIYAYAARVAAQRNDLPTARKLIEQAQTRLSAATRDKNVARGIAGWSAAHVALESGDRAQAIKLAAEARAAFVAQGKNYVYWIRDLERIR